MHDLVYFYPQGHEAHFAPRHPERPERVEAIVGALIDADLWEAFPKLHALETPTDVLYAIHSRKHLADLKQVSSSGGHIDSDTYLTPESWDLGLQAAGGACSVASAVWQGSARRGFALTRPPGHHATPSQAMGFCLMNNIAIAAEYLIKYFGVKKIAIVDVDLHHGNGTQDIFYERGDVLFISTHQFPLYPGTGRIGETGRGPGLGKTVNIPLPPGAGDMAFEAALESIILPLLGRFGPEMLLVSAGMDAHWRDPLGNLEISAAGFGNTIRTLSDWADVQCEGKISLFLEGGYDLKGGAACAVAAVSALLDKPFEDPIGPSPTIESDDWEENLFYVKRQWELK